MAAAPRLDYTVRQIIKKHHSHCKLFKVANKSFWICVETRIRRCRLKFGFRLESKMSSVWAKDKQFANYAQIHKVKVLHPTWHRTKSFQRHSVNYLLWHITRVSQSTQFWIKALQIAHFRTSLKLSTQHGKNIKMQIKCCKFRLHCGKIYTRRVTCSYSLTVKAKLTLQVLNAQYIMNI